MLVQTQLLDRYRGDYRTFDDSIQSSAAVVLASLMSACRHKGTKLADEIILVCGAGNSGCGIASLVAKQIASEGVSEKDAASKIWMVITLPHALMNERLLLETSDWCRVTAGGLLGHHRQEQEPRKHSKPQDPVCARKSSPW